MNCVVVTVESFISRSHPWMEPGVAVYTRFCSTVSEVMLLSPSWWGCLCEVGRTLAEPWSVRKTKKRSVAKRVVGVPWTLTVAVQVCVEVFHTLTVLSALPVYKVLPSGDTAIL